MNEVEEVEERIRECGEKSSQMLLFLSFAILGAATLSSTKEAAAGALRFRQAMSWWTASFFPVLAGVLPVKELHALFGVEKQRWYGWVRWGKVGLLWASVLLSAWGAVRFIEGVWALFFGPK